jgi:hypothetical protein
MRSDLVFSAAANVSNRYLLTSVASKAARMLHKPNVRLEDTSNDVFRAFGSANPIAVVNRSPSQHLAVRASHSAAQDPKAREVHRRSPNNTQQGHQE